MKTFSIPLQWLALATSFLMLPLLSSGVRAQSPAADSLLRLQAGFDKSLDADVAQGDPKLYTADTLARKELREGIHRPGVEWVAEGGVHGGYLKFRSKSPKVICFRGDNLSNQSGSWSITASLFLRLDPELDLQPGYCDPLQITQKAWNDAAFFVDFDKDSPRAFRLGVFSDLSFWNPKNIAWEAWPITSRPMISVAKPPFGRDQWTHVAFAVEGINAGEGKKGKAVFYLNGQSQGMYEAPLQFRWDRDQTAIMLGIDYIGDLDELKVFEGVLTPEQIRSLGP
jgi:hypothetical protein